MILDIELSDDLITQVEEALSHASIAASGRPVAMNHRRQFEYQTLELVGEVNKAMFVSNCPLSWITQMPDRIIGFEVVIPSIHYYGLARLGPDFKCHPTYLNGNVTPETQLILDDLAIHWHKGL